MTAPPNRPATQVRAAVLDDLDPAREDPYPHAVNNTRTIVVGAGLSGLACAFDLVRAGHDVLVLDAAARAGGVAGTIELAGFRFERGPNTVQASAAEFRTWCVDLGIAERLIESAPGARDRYLFHEGALHPLPGSPLAFCRTPLLSLGGKLRLLSEPLRRFRPPAREHDEPNLGAFLADRLGTEAARVFGGAFVRGIYAAELDELGAQSAFPRVWQLAVEHGGFARGAWASRNTKGPEIPGPQFARTSLLSFPRGLQELVDAATAVLGARLRLDAPVAALGRNGSRWRVRLSNGEIEDAARVVLAVPAPVAARFLTVLASGEPSTRLPAEHVAAIRHGRVTLVHVGFARDELPSWPTGFGYLVPPPDPPDSSAPAHRATGEAPRVLGTIFASNLFPGRAPEGCRAVSSFYPGDAVEHLHEDELVDLACRDLARALGSARTPRARVAHVERWNDVIPRYGCGHADRVAVLLAGVREALPGLELAGSWVAGVSVDQVIARGRAVAREIVAGARETARVGGRAR